MRTQVVAALVAATTLFSACSSDSSVRTITPAKVGEVAAPTVEKVGPLADNNGDVPDGVTVPKAVEKPNIVVVMTDDQTLESMRVMTKVNQRIGATGTTFSNSIVTLPTCCPSRATYLTGQYNHNNGVRWNFGKTGGYYALTHQETTFPVALRRAGYRTAHFGKYLNEYGDRNRTEVPLGWVRWGGLVGQSTGQYFNFTLNLDGKLKTYGPNDYQTDVITGLAVDEIRVASKEKRPFFLSVAYFAPHARFGCPLAECKDVDLSQRIREAQEGNDLQTPDPAPKYKNAFADEPLPTKANFDAVGLGQTDGPLRGPLTQDDKDYVLRNYRAELASLKSVDDGVGEIMDALAAAGEAENTVVIFTSDNGYFHGEHRIEFGKYLPYQEALTVPLLMTGPGVAAGQTNDTVVANIDLAPTILDLADVTPLREMDGHTLMPLASNPARLWDRPVLIEGLSPPTQLQPEYRGIRTRKFAYFQFLSGGINGVELYDLENDPDQLNNLVLYPEYRDVVAKFQRITVELRNCEGAQCLAVQSPAGFETSPEPR